MLKNMFKSKTVDFNILLGAIFAGSKGFGYEIPAEVMTSALCIGNFILRFLTTKAIADK